MRTQLVVVAALLATTAVAAAQPSLSALPAEPADPVAPAVSYMEAGIVVGSVQAVDGEFGELAFDLGHHLDGPFWVHARFGTGGEGDPGGGDVTHAFVEARAGLEARGCGLVGSLCVIAGIDVGVRDLEQTGMHDRDDGMRDMIVVPHVGLDIGHGRFRFRPGVEVTTTRQDLAQRDASVVCSFAYLR